MSDIMLLVSAILAGVMIILAIKGFQLYLCSHNKHTWMKVTSDDRQSVHACYYCSKIDVR